MTTQAQSTLAMGTLPEAEESIRAWSNGLFTAWCDAVVTPWNLVPEPTTHLREPGERLSIPEALESGTLSLFA